MYSSPDKMVVNLPRSQVVSLIGLCSTLPGISIRWLGNLANIHSR